MTIGRNIQTRREAVNLSQTKLAQKIEVNPSLITRIESGEKIPSIKILERVAKAVGCEISDLFREKRSR